MSSAFFEFGIAKSALFTAQGALGVTAHNIANAGAPGYSRQVAGISASTPLRGLGGRGMVGTGSMITGVNQIRDIYLDDKFRTQSSGLGEYQAKSDGLAIIQSIFGDLSTSDLNANLNNFFGSLQSLSTTANDSTFRTNVIQSANQLATFVNATAQSLQKQQSDLNGEVAQYVNQINNLGNQIAELNRQIALSENRGAAANDLRDQRNNLLDKLSSIVNISTKEVTAPGGQKQLYVMIDGNQFVNGPDVYTLEVRARKQPLNPMDAGGLYDIYYANSNIKLNVYSPTMSGALKGAIDLRDGNDGRCAKGVSGTSGAGLTSVVITGLSASRTDLSQNGTLAVMDPRTGIVQNLDYSGFTAAAATGSVTSAASGSKTLSADGLAGDLASLPAGGGSLLIKDPSTGVVLQTVDYTSYTVNADGTIDFTLAANANVPEGAAITPDSYTFALKAPADVAAGSTVTIGKTDDYKGIPYFMDRLNTFVRTFARAVNEGLDKSGAPIPGVAGLINGYDAYGNQSGALLFTYAADGGVAQATGAIPDYNGMNCLNFTVSKELADNPLLMGNASYSTAGVSNNDVVLGLAKLKDYTGLFSEGRVGDYVSGSAGTLGIEKAQADNFSKSYTSVVSAVDRQRQSVSSVDLNEEMSNMVKFQQVYHASSLLINTINNVYNNLINVMGV